jgi:hypothetical protein
MKEYTVRMLENKVLRKIFLPRKDEIEKGS